MGISGAANIDQSYREGKAEKHTGENNAKVGRFTLKAEAS
jgi:hypothetical protein